MNEDDPEQKERTLGEICIENNICESARGTDGIFYCNHKFVKNKEDCKYVIEKKEGNKNKLCGYYYPKLMREQRSFEERLKDSQIKVLERYVNFLRPKVRDLFNIKRQKKYKIALGILKRRKSNV